MTRRQFVMLVGSAAVAPSILRPLAARAQRAGIPVIGFLASNALDESAALQAAGFRQGLAETGYVEGKNVAIEYRDADNRYDRLPALAAELVSRRVAVITTRDTASALAAKAATTTIPIVFSFGSDPVALGLVASLNRPGGNITGVTFLANLLLPAKLLELLHDAVPGAGSVGFLVNPSNPNVESDTREVQAAADALGLKLVVAKAGSDNEIDAAFVDALRQGVAAFYINADPFLSSRRDQLITLAARHALPTIHWQRDYAVAGGLMSYGASTADVNRQVGIYVGRILKGAKPADLPVQQAVKVELVLNLKTAKVLGLTFPLTLLGRADEVIE
jgi:putative tryptophan/tyrosine transport system substrate-binding protein